MKSKEDIFVVVCFVILSAISILILSEINYNTKEENFYVADKNWHIKISEYWTEYYTEWEKRCTKDSNGKESCSDHLVFKSRNHWIKDCRAGGEYDTPVYYPPCPQSRNDSWFSTNEYFNIIFARDTERMTLYVDLDTYNNLKRERVCNLNVYRGSFGTWLRSLNSCK